MKKLSKLEMVKAVKEFGSNAKKEVREIVDYTVKAYHENPRNVTMEDLKETLDMLKEMAVPQTVLPIENSIKKVAKKEDKKEQPKKIVSRKDKAVISDEDAEKALEDILSDDILDGKELEEELIEAEKELALDDTKNKGGKKIVSKKSTEKADTTKTAKKEEPKETKKIVKKEDKKPSLKTTEILAEMPKEFDSLIGTLKVRPDIKDIKALHKAIEDGEQLVICVYWNKRQLKQFTYDTLGINPKKFTEFPFDLDIVDIMYASENGLAVYGVSLYTEVAMTFTPGQFTTDEDTGLRYENGAEYQIYEVLE